MLFAPAETCLLHTKLGLPGPLSKVDHFFGRPQVVRGRVPPLLPPPCSRHHDRKPAGPAGRALLQLTALPRRVRWARPSATMAEKSCTIRTRKFMTNRLLSRRQFVSDGGGRGNVALDCGGTRDSRPHASPTCRSSMCCTLGAPTSPRSAPLGGRPRLGAVWAGDVELRAGRRHWAPLRQGPRGCLARGRLDGSHAALIWDLPGRPAPAMQTELREKLARMYDVKDDKQVFVFGLKTQVSLPGSLPGPRHAPGHPSTTPFSAAGPLRTPPTSPAPPRAVRWRQVDRLRPDLRQPGRGQEVRAQVQAHQGESKALVAPQSRQSCAVRRLPAALPFIAPPAERAGTGRDQVAQAEEGEEEPHQDHPRRQEERG